MKTLGEVSMQLMRFVLPPRGSFNTQSYWAARRITQISRKKRQGRVTHATRQYESFSVEKKIKSWPGSLYFVGKCLQWKREVRNQNNPLIHIRIEHISLYSICAHRLVWSVFKLCLFRRKKWQGASFLQHLYNLIQSIYCQYKHHKKC